MEKFKIALVSDWYYPKIGGIEYAIDSLARNFVAQGHEVHIITRRYDQLQSFAPIKEVTVIRLRERELTKRFLSPGAYKELYDIIKNGEYDIIHAHGLDSPLAISSLMISRIINIPAVITNHSLAEKGLIRIPLHLAGKIFLRYPDAIIAVSSAVVKDTRIMSNKPVYLIPNGIDILSSDGADMPIELEKKGRIVVTNVSRMTKKKGVDSIVEIAPSLIEAHQNLLFMMVGDGPLKDKLEKQVKKQNMELNFIFTGEVSRKTVFYLLGNSDIFLMPSKDEAFGIAILEAFAKMVPVIARNNSGTSDIITHEKTGFLAENKEELIKYIVKLIDEPELRTKLSDNAHEELKKYEWPDIARKVINVYTQVIHEKNCYHN
ncbi:glycosyltransferase family 4 protein [Methanomethylovorans hollandica]|uniref:glycosyltransferase family 4 protein n=1 Tax=Methanomethylovorans hollandica TaxID=101192 RepID=UPI0009FC6FF7|nr:glycosyltransferase family 4 protein [Methanomethylovorans hollandica]